MPSQPNDSSDAALRRALDGFGEEVGAQKLVSALRDLGVSGDGATSVVGDFRLIEELGRGGMGIVFAAEQVSVPGRRVAVKLVRGFAGSDIARQRFHREVEVVGRLDHPHIVPILSADVAADPPFFAMKYIEGSTLREHLNGAEERKDYRRFATMIRDLANALQHAHDHGVVHRDVKPGNVLVDLEDRAMLLDFGLARLFEDDSDLTMSTDAVGTPDYMAPEQVRSSFGSVSPRTDVYALGVTLYECLAGAVPFASESRHETMTRIVRGEAPRLRQFDRSIPHDLENICAMAMQREPQDRYVSAAALAQDLNAFLQDLPVRARPPSLPRRAKLALKKHRLLAIAAGTVLVAFSASAIYWRWFVPAQQVQRQLLHADDLLRQRSEVQQKIAMHAQNANTDNALRELRRLRAEEQQLESHLESTFEACLSIVAKDPATLRRYANLLAEQLRRMLAGAGPLLRGVEIDRTQRQLERFDSDGRYQDLLRTDGNLQVQCQLGEARIWLCPANTAADDRIEYSSIDDPETIDFGTTPHAHTVPEGSYLLRAQLADHVDIILPILVRRLAVQSQEEQLVDLQFLTAEAIGPCYRQIHPGYGIAFDDSGERDPSDYMRRYDGFMITEREVWREDAIRLQGGEITPAVREELEKFDRTVVQDVKWDDLMKFLGGLNQREAELGTDYYSTLPTPDEWQRAGRGADGRPFPWGWHHEWSFSQNYISSASADHVLIPTEFPREDTSPFLVRDLIGSAREVCVPLVASAEIGTKQFLVCGGSMYSIRRDDLTLSSKRTLLHNQQVPDAGLRLVRRALPEIPSGPKTLSLTGSRLDAWQLIALRAPLFEYLPAGSRTKLVDGALQLRGYGGNFSAELIAWRGIRIPSDSFRLRVRGYHHHDERFGHDRGWSIVLGTRPGFDHLDQRLSLGVTVKGCQLAMKRGKLIDARTFSQVPADTPIDIELTATPEAYVGTVRIGEQSNVVRIDRPADSPSHWNYVAPVLPSWVGTVLTITSFELTEL